MKKIKKKHMYIGGLMIASVGVTILRGMTEIELIHTIPILLIYTGGAIAGVACVRKQHQNMSFVTCKPATKIAYLTLYATK